MSHRIIAERKVELNKGRIIIPVYTPIDTDLALYYTLAMLRSGFEVELKDGENIVFQTELRYGDIRLRRDMSNKVRYMDEIADFPEFFQHRDWDIRILDKS